eukprot:m51a1_g7351 hypothetical protein (139) ;mRNA; f:21598-23623
MLGVLPDWHNQLVSTLEGEEYVLDSQGRVPRRWLLMMIDFWFKHESGAHVVPTAPEAENTLLQQSIREWESRIGALPATVLQALQVTLHMINSSRRECRVSVVQAPPYTMEQVKELLGCSFVRDCKPMAVTSTSGSGL